MKGFLIALQFLTRFSFSVKLKLQKDEFSSAIKYFPAVGLFLGGILVLVAFVGQQIFQPFTTVIMLVCVEILITGGLHLDGFMDTCDGIFSGAPREKMLTIMKDSRVGAMGVIGLIILVLLKVAFLNEMYGPYFLTLLLVMPLVGRWAMVLVLGFYPYARREGLGGLFQRRVRYKDLLGASFLSIVVLFISLPRFLWVSIILTAISVLVFSLWINKLLKGHTGDTYGAVNEFTEVFFLFCSVLVIRLFM